MIDSSELRLYAITDGSENLAQKVRDAIKGGATIVQLREKGLTLEEYVAKVKEIAAVCHEYGVKLIVNDSYKAAILGGADGVHLGQADGSIRRAREECGENFVIGATAKTLEQAQRAAAEGADYLGVGAIFPSKTKSDALRTTPEMFNIIAEKSGLPCVAIGGIGHENIHLLSGLKQSGVAVVSAIFGADDVQKAAVSLTQLFNEQFQMTDDIFR